MITYKIKYESEEINIIKEYIREYNVVYRYAYNRFLEYSSLSLSNVIKIVKDNIKNIKLLDATIIQNACEKAKYIFNKTENKKIIFGGKNNYFRYIKGLISKEEYKNKKNIPFYIRGQENSYGNRKFRINTLNKEIIFQPSRSEKYKLKLRIDEKRLKDLEILENKCLLCDGSITVGIDLEYIYISFEETLINYEPIGFKENRLLSIDLNPNYISYVISDYDEKDRTNIIYKEIVSLKKLNDLDNRKNYINKEDKLSYRKHLHNKKKFEILGISKYIVEKAKHYKVESIIIEDLNIKNSNKKLGKRFNKLCNNDWLRNTFVNNLIKRCNIYGIRLQKVLACYSSFIGQLNNKDEFDSIAAAMELGRRGNLFIRNYIKSKNKVDVVYPKFDIRSLMDQWKKKLNFDRNIKSWKELYNKIKETKQSYRFLFNEDKNLLSSFSLSSHNSYIKCYHLI